MKNDLENNGFIIKSGKLTLYTGNKQIVYIPNGITKIGKFAFSDCSSLKYIDIPISVIEIEDYAFNNCTQLSDIRISSNIKIHPTAFFGSPLHNRFTSCINSKRQESLSYYERKKLNSSFWTRRIKDGYSVKFCKSTDKSIIIPQLSGNEKIIKIGKNAFRDNTDVTSIILPEGIIEICEGAFLNCNNLTSIKLPNSLCKIDKYAFCGCQRLLKINISENVKSIGEYAFSECTFLSIHTKKNSYAEKYAIKHNINIFSLP